MQNVIQHEDLSRPGYERLKEMIANGTLSPGHKLIQEKLANELGESRTPLLKVLQYLSMKWLSKAFPEKE